MTPELIMEPQNTDRRTVSKMCPVIADIILPPFCQHKTDATPQLLGLPFTTDTTHILIPNIIFN
jgi:hypothetical protein